MGGFFSEIADVAVSTYRWNAPTWLGGAPLRQPGGTTYITPPVNGYSLTPEEINQHRTNANNYNAGFQRGALNTETGLVTAAQTGEIGLTIFTAGGFQAVGQPLRLAVQQGPRAALRYGVGQSLRLGMQGFDPFLSTAIANEYYGQQGQPPLASLQERFIPHSWPLIGGNEHYQNGGTQVNYPRGNHGIIHEIQQMWSTVTNRPQSAVQQQNSAQVANNPAQPAPMVNPGNPNPANSNTPAPIDPTWLVMGLGAVSLALLGTLMPSLTQNSPLRGRNREQHV